MNQTAMQEFYREQIALDQEHLRQAQGHLDKAWSMLLEILASGTQNEDLIQKAKDSVESCAAWVGRLKNNITRYESEL